MTSHHTAAQCRAMGLQIGDTIEGRQEWPDGWQEARLTLVWMGETVAVWKATTRTKRRPTWSPPEESSLWTLNCREWRKVTA